MATANEIVTKLIALGVSTAFGTDIFIDHLPESGEALVVAVFNSGGSAPTLGFGQSTYQFENPTVQIKIRGEAYDSDTPRAKAQTAYEGLGGVQAATLSGGSQSAFYHTIIPLQPPFIVERDENNRVVWAFNCAIEKELSA